MTPTDVAVLLAAFAAGMGLGVIFFGGLWLTLRRFDLASALLGLWLAASFLLRTGIVLCGMYFVFGGNWHRLCAGLLGFFVARLLVTRLARPPCQRHAELEAAGAP